MFKSTMCLRWIFSLLLLAGFVVGCGKSGPPTFKVTGKVTYESAPVTQGTISFFDPQTGKSGQSPLDAEGTYQVQVEAGNYQVSVCPPFQTDVVGVNTPREGEYLEVDNIPRKYWAEGTSGFTADVNDAKTEFSFDMKKS